MNHLSYLSLLAIGLVPSASTPAPQNLPATSVPVVPSNLGSADIYCQANLNSVGTRASIGNTGSFAIADRTFGLTVVGCPPVATSWGMFTCGSDQTNIPFGNGHLCVSPFANGIYRMRTQSLAQGAISISMVNDEKYFGLCTPGSSWNFQFWYRDPAAGGSNFNLSNAVHVNFAL